jgi:hypothetical protein
MLRYPPLPNQSSDAVLIDLTKIMDVGFLTYNRVDYHVVPVSAPTC